MNIASTDISHTEVTNNTFEDQSTAISDGGRNTIKRFNTGIDAGMGIVTNEDQTLCNDGQVLINI